VCGRRVRVDLASELVRTGRAHEEVERSRPESVALSDRLQPAYQKVLGRSPGLCRIRAEVFVAGVRGRPTRGAPKEKGTAIMKVTTTTQVSVDGVMQGNGGPNVLDVGFKRAGWARPLFDSEAMTFVDQVYSAPTRSCSAGGPTSFSPATGARRSGLAPRRKIRATTRSQLP
jgi:hypothetical protein